MPEKAAACAPPSTVSLTYPQIMDVFAQYVAEERPKLQAPADVAALMRPLLTGKRQEEFHVLLLDTKHRLIHDHIATVGLVDRSQIHSRSVFRAAIQHTCSRIILVHNHPSGDATPSNQDIACTRELVAAGKIVGIEILDHLVIGEKTVQKPKYWLSFREEGLM